MQPTMKLRWVRRKSSEFIGKDDETKEYVWMKDTRVLQQMFENSDDLTRSHIHIEWRDIPIDEET